MKTQEELCEEFQRLFDADLLDEAEAILDKLEPLSDEEIQQTLKNAPLDDEPVSARERAGFEEIRRFLDGQRRQRAG
jgi:hypothetical protein